MPKKTKPFVRALCVLLALVAALSLTMVTAFAEELPVERATENSATVSDEVDTADNSDPHMGTTYYMYLAPDIVATNPPDMGVSGPSTDALILLAVAVGCAYLCVSAYAHGGKDEQAADAVFERTAAGCVSRNQRLCRPATVSGLSRASHTGTADAAAQGGKHGNRGGTGQQ